MSEEAVNAEVLDVKEEITEAIEATEATESIEATEATETPSEEPVAEPIPENNGSNEEDQKPTNGDTSVVSTNICNLFQ